MQYVEKKKKQEWPWQKCVIGSSDFLRRGPFGLTDNLIQLPTALKQYFITDTISCLGVTGVDCCWEDMKRGLQNQVKHRT